jgi:serine protease inhibitor
MQPGNLFFSPYSIFAGLGMVHAGARGQTERELAAALHFTMPPEALQSAFGELAARMESVQHWRHLTLLPANSLWCQRDYPLAPAFEDLIRAGYHGEVIPVDFKRSPQEAASKLAAWIGRKTRGRLGTAFDPGIVTTDTRLALCNAIYFKGTWASPFDASETRPGPFYITADQAVTVPMMDHVADFNMGHSEDYTISFLELPYYGRDLSMIILLPDKADGLPDLEQQLDTTNLQTWLGRLDQGGPDKTVVYMPRFSFMRSVDMVPALKGMGVTNLFDMDADLSGMDNTTNLFISDVLHQAFVEVNEQGTEAAAMTLGMAKAKGGPSSFIANHPFLFLIRENATGTILFLGRMIDPTKP